MLRIPHQRTAAFPLVREQIESESLFPDFDIRRLTGPFDQGPDDLLPGGVPQSMRHPAVTVATFMTEGDLAVFLVEDRAVADQLANAIGGLPDHQFDDRDVAQALAGGQRVGHVVGEIVDRIENASDAPLGPRAVRELHAVLGGHHHVEPGIDFEGRPHPRDAGSDNQHIREEMRDPLRIEPHEIPPLGGNPNRFHQRVPGVLSLNSGADRGASG